MIFLTGPNVLWSSTKFWRTLFEKSIVDHFSRMDVWKTKKSPWKVLENVPQKSLKSPWKRYVMICGNHVLIEELGLHLLPGNPTYNLTDFSASEVLTTINRFSLPSEYIQPMKSSICHTFIGFQRCTKIPINTDSLRVPRSVRPSLYPFYSQARFSEVLRNSVLKKWVQSDLDPQEFKRIIRTSLKHQVLWFFDPLHNHSSPET